MSLSAEYYSDKTGDRGGGGGVALAHQRRMIRGLLVWATLLTLGLATSITLHFIYRESPAPSKLQVWLRSVIYTLKNKGYLLALMFHEETLTSMEHFHWFFIAKIKGCLEC